MLVAVLLGVLVLAGLVVALVVRARRRRLAARWRLAAQDQGFPLLLPQLARLLEGEQQRVRAQLVGQRRGVSVLAFEVLFRTTGPGSGAYVPHVVVVAPRPVPGPWLLLTPRGDGVWQPLDEPVDTGDPLLDARFQLRRLHPGFAAAWLATGVGRSLVADPRAAGAAILFGEHTVAAVVPGTAALTPLDQLADLLLDLCARVPWPALPRG
ncbi:hypothetical protein [Umezawaea beigongshangensis]|uniref:hypothetical protein n=1 Tax=Umezawaea beigongshangensis TaxID=2780383 RepID=UPI0018F1AB38|nr:hypothetical protein [Umezawaea beigongshangensis]